MNFTFDMAAAKIKKKYILIIKSEGRVNLDIIIQAHQKICKEYKNNVAKCLSNAKEYIYIKEWSISFPFHQQT